MHTYTLYNNKNHVKDLIRITCYLSVVSLIQKHFNVSIILQSLAYEYQLVINCEIKVHFTEKKTIIIYFLLIFVCYFFIF